MFVLKLVGGDGYLVSSNVAVKTSEKAKKFGTEDEAREAIAQTRYEVEIKPID